jgi:enamine deaminase RidA (YjgF/YER057c/UK114 family)
MKASYAGTLVLNVYSPNPATAEKTRALAPEFLGPSTRPAVSLQIVEGLPSPDATVAIELVAVAP